MAHAFFVRHSGGDLDGFWGKMFAGGGPAFAVKGCLWLKPSNLEKKPFDRKRGRSRWVCFELGALNVCGGCWGT